MTSAVITEVLGTAFLAITPEERWGAAREFTLDFTLERWMIVVCVIAMIVLGVLFLWGGFRRAKEEEKAFSESFAGNAKALGLTSRENQLLTIAADRAGLKRAESIFTMDTAFERGAAKVIEDGFGGEQSDEGREQLKIEFSFLREKLGFGKRRGSSAGAKGLSSRQITVGKTLYITRRNARGSEDIESTVVKNSAAELVIKVSRLVGVTFGEIWCVRYYSGVSVWEFDTTVVSCNGDVLVLNHSERVRFINRRCFLRVPVKRRAFIAQFPFVRTVVEQSVQEEQAEVDQDLSGTCGLRWGPPEFVPAVVTELAGPGLRMESALEMKVGQRVLVVFSLYEEDGRDSEPAPEGDKTAAPKKIIQNIGEVRHGRAVENGFSIAVELTDLSDSDVDELILGSNTASLKSVAGGKDVPPSAESEERVLEPAAAQGD